MKKDMFMLVIAALFAAAAVPAAGQQAEKRHVASIDADGIQRVALTGSEYFFEPNVIVVKVNVPVELTYRKAGGMTPHDLVLQAPEAGIDLRLELGSEQKVVSFMATKTGTYPFACTKRFLFFKSHKDRGMHGVLEVVE